MLTLGKVRVVVCAVSRLYRRHVLATGPLLCLRKVLRGCAMKTFQMGHLVEEGSGKVVFVAPGTVDGLLPAKIADDDVPSTNMSPGQRVVLAEVAALVSARN